ncbi:MAG: head-tail adaptor protein [Hyphomonadaceae bacterium]
MSEVIGRHRTRVELRHPVRTADDLGGASLAYESAGFTWAEIEPRGGAFGEFFDGPGARTSYRFILRGPYDVRAGWRLVIGGRTLEVRGVSHLDVARLALDCVEEGP